MLVGCDISHHQSKGFNTGNAEFVIVKATEGKTYTDDCFISHIEKAKNENKLLGAYHYARPENKNTPIEEANNFVKAVKPYIPNVLLALDWEDKAWNYPLSWALEWLNEVYRLTGIKPLIYVSASKVSLLTDIAKAGYGIWIASWSTTKPSHSPFTVCAIWQYTNRPYDMDKFYGTKETWLKYCTPLVPINKTQEKEEVKEIEKPLEETIVQCDCDVCKAIRKIVYDTINQKGVKND